LGSPSTAFAFLCARKPEFLGRCNITLPAAFVSKSEDGRRRRRRRRSMVARFFCVFERKVHCFSLAWISYSGFCFLVFVWKRHLHSPTGMQNGRLLVLLLLLDFLCDSSDSLPLTMDG
jgi:hypothetical protein